MKCGAIIWLRNIGGIRENTPKANLKRISLGGKLKRRGGRSGRKRSLFKRKGKPFK
jgi:hypothetical protein